MHMGGKRVLNPLRTHHFKAGESEHPYKLSVISSAHRLEKMASSYDRVYRVSACSRHARYPPISERKRLKYYRARLPNPVTRSVTSPRPYRNAATPLAAAVARFCAAGQSMNGSG